MSLKPPKGCTPVVVADDKAVIAAACITAPECHLFSFGRLAGYGLAAGVETLAGASAFAL